MRRSLRFQTFGLLCAAAFMTTPIQAQEELRVGVIGNLSGVFASSGTTMVNGAGLRTVSFARTTPRRFCRPNLRR